MFYYINGELTYKTDSIAVLDCGGVGYKLTVSRITSDSLSSSMGKRVKLLTHLAVREDDIELFGFSSEEERECFNNLTSVSGIGPKVAMSILSVMSPAALASAIYTENVKQIAKAPGIGAKTAARIVLELKDKMAKAVSSADSSMLTEAVDTQKNASTGNLAEATEALTVLGYDKASILNAIKGIDPKTDVGEIIRTALKRLSR